ncbi:hypothetical protein PWP93_36695 [Paraburkholderia sp. A1RI-2L]|uniref:hypothetical protein n=1 Tax=Paraburkholderia sp. A1RI-2L TaxID=3028367 RepID=UPI003B80A5F4
MGAQLPDRAIQIGRRIVERWHAAVMAGDERLIKAGMHNYDRLICAINGGTTFGCRADDEAPACLLEAALSAPDGETPLWGQSGRLFIVVNGMPCVVSIESGLNSFGAAHFEFRACTADMPFISETGYRSDYQHHMRAGATVREAAEARFRTCQSEGIRELQAGWKMDEDLRKPFVTEGLRSIAATLPVPGLRIWLDKQMGLVTPDTEANAAGMISVALVDVQKDGRYRNAPLSTVVNRRVWPWEVRKVNEAELSRSADAGKFLTLEMVEAIQESVGGIQA